MNGSSLRRNEGAGSSAPNRQGDRLVGVGDRLEKGGALEFPVAVLADEVGVADGQEGAAAAAVGDAAKPHLRLVALDPLEIELPKIDALDRIAARGLGHR